MVKMKKEVRLKLVGGFVLVIVVLNLILFAFRVIDWIVFLIILASGFLFVKKGLPWLKEKY